MATDEPVPDPRLRHRLRLVTASLFLVALTFVTRPGLMIADTKIDFALDPSAFAARALHAWDPAQFGQLQNQANGYLFPMAEFFMGGALLSLDGWVVQRLWMSVLVLAAFIGLYRLAGRLEIGTPTTRLVAALGFALSPRLMTDLGVLSSEVQPVALLPWVMLPLVTAVRRGGSRVGCAARSALAVALCGGVNAASVLAVLVVPFLYIMTRDRTARRWRLLGWWTLMVTTATLWWTVPLAIMARYGFSFLPYTESSAAITPVTSLTNILRGTPDWVAWLVGSGGPTLPVGHALSLTPWLVVVTALVAAAGLAGVLRRDAPERFFLAILLLTGILLVSAGHISAIEPSVAPAVRDLLDGPLAPLRNLRKFDAVLRLPLALGLAHLLATARPKVRIPVVAVLAASVVPALLMGLAGPGPIRQLPTYWGEAAAWLNARTGRQAVLALPGSRFAEYLWGRPLDEPVQQLLTVRWAERQIGAAGSAGLTRLLDAVDRQVAAGRGGPGLAEVLGRIGVRYVLVRNDLDRVELAGAWPARIHQALADSPGLTPVAAFGPATSGGLSTDDAVDGLDLAYPALEVYEVAGASDVVSLRPVSDLLRVGGSPESLLDLADQGVLDERPVVLNADDAGTEPAATLSTDTLRDRTRHFGLLRTGLSPTLTARESPRAATTPGDYLDPAWGAFRTRARHEGIRSVSASTSGSDPGALPAQQQGGYLPFAALDGDLRTAWRSGGWDGAAGQWWRVDFEGPRDPSGTKAVLVPDRALGPVPVRIAVETERGTREQTVSTERGEQLLQTPPGTTSWLRIRFVGFDSAASRRTGTVVSLSEVQVPGLFAARTYDVPGPAATSYLFARDRDDAPACMRGPDRWVCHWSLERSGEEAYGFDRTFTADARRVTLTGRAVLTDTALADRYSRFSQLPSASASSQAHGGTATWARAAFDGDPATTWLPDAADDRPELVLKWKDTKRIDRITVTRPPAARSVVPIAITGDDGSLRAGILDGTGVFTFKALRSSGLRISFGTAAENVQVTDVVVPGVRPVAAAPQAPFALPCGLGPPLDVNGVTVATKVRGTHGDVMNGRPLRFTSCGQAALATGANRVRSWTYSPFRIEDLAVGAEALPPAPTETALSAARVLSWTATSRRIEVTTDSAAFLTVAENQNKGWTASLGGERLRPVRLDGWRQGFVVPAGSQGVVTLTFGPDRSYRAGLAAGLAGLALVAAVAATARRRVTRPESPAARKGLPGLLGIPAGALAGFWVAGLPGTAVVTVLVTVLVAGRRFRALRSPWPAPALLGLAGAITAVGLARGSDVLTDQVPQLLCCAAVAAIVAAVADRQAGAEPADRLLEEPVGELGHRDGHGQGEREDEKVGRLAHPRADHPGEPEQQQGVPEVDPVGDDAEPAHDPAPEEQGERVPVAGVQGQRGDEQH
ncbi:alpha-(1-_3)-arabinofuranosyltransferase [Actinocorallia longicatena]|uniref:Alpha-(1->3)-arabinofuranosyltransferase n=1 Tax=Actinocorallia longicatena TaxID=111803 RepID=A0ABP6PWK8_9ACTN